jgi:NhaA family Na+:H+ antiporter
MKTAPILYKITGSFRQFVRSQQFSGFLLIGCTLASLALANSSWSSAYLHLFHHPLAMSLPGVADTINPEWLINDGLMAVFFLLVGLEIKRELLVGELSSFRQASLPVMAALGGMLAPALFYTAFNAGTNGASGWGIPMATDIAFALGVLSLLGDRVPLPLKVFLTALAVVDDLGAVGVIAIFYSQGLVIDHLLYAAGILGLLLLFNRLGVRSAAVYLIPGVFLWYFILRSGIHATVAGVLLALTIPYRTRGGAHPLTRLEDRLHTPVNYLIMPLFALANTAIPLHRDMLGALADPIGLGVISGLVFGKPTGILLFSWMAVKSGMSRLPGNAKFKDILGLGLLGGVGFTMAIFIALLAFSGSEQIVQAKVAILLASLISGLGGYFFLNSVLHGRTRS